MNEPSTAGKAEPLVVCDECRSRVWAGMKRHGRVLCGICWAAADDTERSAEQIAGAFAAAPLFGRIGKELETARSKFPSSELCMAALTEEMGELAKALLDEPWERVVEEAIQVAAMAIRVAEEGDPTFDDIRRRRGLGAGGMRPNSELNKPGSQK